ncbi:glyoxylate pathway regulator [Ceratobasidium sp. AG-Ba]|nr:glyoxylate pathway regulator [Ceratobasidium sp. AG-Ba]
MATTTAAPTTAPAMNRGSYPDTTNTHDGLTGHHGEYGNGKGGRPGFFRRDSQPGFPDYSGRRTIANPSPTGLFALAATTLMWSLYNARTRGIYQVNAVIGMALLVGGLCTLLAGMWEFAIGNTFGATGKYTTFTLLGGFWGSYSIMYWNGTGALSPYGDELGDALGIFYMVWMVVALMLFLATFRSSIPLSGFFFFLFLTYILLGAAHFTGRVSVLRAGGVIGCIASVFAFYSGAVGLHNRHTTYYNTPALGLSKRTTDPADTARY